MRKLIAIVFLLIFTSSTEAGELLKLPLLANHYLLHKVEGRSGNFFDFLKEHYIDHHGKDSDNQQDQELPFKVLHAEHFTYNFVASEANIIKPPALMIANKTESLPSEDLPLNLSYSIFHPPRSNC